MVMFLLWNETNFMLCFESLYVLGFILGGVLHLPNLFVMFHCLG
jgi:hypothetical protein